MKGIVTKSTGSWYTVRGHDGTITSCKIKGNLRLKGFRCTNPVAVGDVVEFDLKPDGTAFIRGIEPRRKAVPAIVATRQLVEKHAKLEDVYWSSFYQGVAYVIQTERYLYPGTLDIYNELVLARKR